MGINRITNEIPEGYEFIELGKGQYLVRKGYMWILDTLEASRDGGTEVKGKDVTVTGGGRGTTISMAVPGDDEGRIVLRRSLRGGILAKVLGGTYFGLRPRMFEEARITAYGISRGLPAAEVLVAAKEQVAPFIYGGWIITREIPRGQDLLTYLRTGRKAYDPEGLRRKRFIIAKAAESIAEMHDIGIYHGDLHLRNILVQINARKSVRVFLIDFDKSRLVGEMGMGRRMRNLMRLYRSVVKESGLVRTVTSRDIERFLLAYFRGDPSKRRAAARTLRLHALFLLLHRIWWRLLGS
ncbi:lipopolysaccharide kinase InaA family protein [Thermodesulfobacteriota bacterium]